MVNSCTIIMVITAKIARILIHRPPEIQTSIISNDPSIKVKQKPRGKQETRIATKKPIPRAAILRFLS